MRGKGYIHQTPPSSPPLSSLPSSLALRGQQMKRQGLMKALQQGLWWDNQ